MADPAIVSISMEDYAQRPGASWSRLKSLRKSPLQYRHEGDTPRADTGALAGGRAVHVATLEPDRFAAEYTVMPREYLEDRTLLRTTKEGKERWKAWLEEHPGDAELDAEGFRAAVFRSLNPGKEVLKLADYQNAIAVRDAVRWNPVAGPWLEAGTAEESIFWTDHETGVECKGRMDWRNGAIVELKTTQDITARRFAADAAKYGYHCQAAHYRDGVFAVTEKWLRHVLIVVESAPPYDVAVFEFPSSVLDAGHHEVAGLLRRLKACRERNEWPGMYDAPQPLYLPAWATGGE